MKFLKLISVFFVIFGIFPLTGCSNSENKNLRTNKVISSDHKKSFSDPQPIFKDDFKNIPTDVVSKYESTRSGLTEFEIYTRYNVVREYLLKNGWKAVEKRANYPSYRSDDRYGQMPNPNRACSITDPKKQAELGVDLSGNSKISSKPMTLEESNKPKTYALYFSKPNADSSVIMDECLYPETKHCQYSSYHTKNKFNELWCQMKWVRKEGSYPNKRTETINLYTAKLMPKAWNIKNFDTYANKGNPCEWGIVGRGDDGTSNHCIKRLKYSIKYQRPTIPGDLDQFGNPSYLSNQNKVISADILKEI